MKGFAVALGTAIRYARKQNDLTLRDVEVRSGGRFKPSAVGAYERGERDLSVERLVGLARVIGKPPQELVTDALHRVSPRTHEEVVIDLRQLSQEHGPAAVAVGEWSRMVQIRRRDFLGDVITLRAGDLDVLAGEAGIDAPSLLRTIEHAIVRVGPD